MLMFVSKSKAYLSVAYFRCSTLVGFTLAHMHYTRQDMPVRDKPFVILGYFEIYSRKKFYNIGSRPVQ